MSREIMGVYAFLVIFFFIVVYLYYSSCMKKDMTFMCYVGGIKKGSWSGLVDAPSGVNFNNILNYIAPGSQRFSGEITQVEFDDDQSSNIVEKLVADIGMWVKYNDGSTSYVTLFKDFRFSQARLGKNSKVFMLGVKFSSSQLAKSGKMIDLIIPCFMQKNTVSVGNECKVVTYLKC